MKVQNGSRRTGFTLVEVLIVVVILGILAATVLPQFSQATKDAKESSLVQNLQMIRHQIGLYKFQHDGKLPAAGTADVTLFTNQMTQRTMVDGTVDPANGNLGPYIVGQLPPNAYNNSRTIIVKNGALTADDYNGSGSHGWAFSSTTGEVRANVDPAIKSVVETTKSVNDF
jgi:prepilin-type N-terminal cleavage/methylation domain-containing protein